MKMKQLPFSILSAALAGTMLVGYPAMVPVFAEEDAPVDVTADTPSPAAANSYSITLQDGVPNASYSVYQLFTGTYAEPGSDRLGDIAVNSQLRPIIISTLQQVDTSFTVGTGSTADQDNKIAQAISDIQAGTNGDVSIQNFANALAQNISSAQTAPSAMKTANANAQGGLTFDGLPSGYYIVVSNGTNGYGGTNGGYTRAILVPLSENKTITVKTTEVTNISKNAIVDGTATKVTQTEIVNGKVVVSPYQISADVHNLYQFKEYPFSFVDALPPGLTTTSNEVSTDWNVTATVTIGDQSFNVRPSMTIDVTTDQAKNQSTINFEFADLIAALKKAGATDAQINSFDSTFGVTLQYTPVYDETDIQALYDAASSLKDPQINTAHAVYPTSPYQPTPGPNSPTTTTPGSSVNTYTYNLTIHKVDDTGKALTGSEWSLTNSKGETIGKNITASDDGTFTFTGLAAGDTYTLTETKVPAGMQQIDPITFTITSEEGQDKLTITSISGEVNGNEEHAVATVDDATVTLTVTNNPGAPLPTTGMGGYALLGIGGVALAGSLVMVLKREKKNS